ncbi:MAG: ATP phosphoribosyltransferase [Flammeovirgaceae bacterium]|nr:ATP phosphoribosyltransferase [Flammeovirgaceae bacterium]MBE63546.1 ATP phosphoribosyltransferase [Flammeovirgaceae bacterium]MBR08709.1 ATP phosphoribosyltransferase [Rickettsiales bacterium]HCX23153.1 ATP phosphoribosyltransferase [Cytophagales bacterium]|tara:strand:- start:376 stop:1233 length:858 start_codon:yes stop_codon:yes gene_type:complete
MATLKVAVQKSGRLSEDSLKLFRECGIKFNNGVKKLKAQSHNFPIEFLFLRDDDIPGYVEDGIADIGIVGQNVHDEYQKNVEVVKHLGFSKCRLSLAVPREEDYQDISYFEGKNIATSYPNILKDYLKNKGVSAEVHEISGSVEIAPGIGLAEGICDIVSSGSTLLSNGLKEVETVMKSEAVMVASKSLSDEQQKILNQLIFRINSVLEGKNNKYVLLNAPNESLDKIIDLLPGMRSPTVLPLADKGWSSIHSVINEDTFWENIEQLREAGAEGILVVPIEKMIR